MAADDVTECGGVVITDGEGAVGGLKCVDGGIGGGMAVKKACDTVGVPYPKRGRQRSERTGNGKAHLERGRVGNEGGAEEKEHEQRPRCRGRLSAAVKGTRQGVSGRFRKLLRGRGQWVTWTTLVHGAVPKIVASANPQRRTARPQPQRARDRRRAQPQ